MSGQIEKNPKRERGTPLYLELGSSEDDEVIENKKSYKYVVDTPIRSRLSRNRPNSAKTLDSMSPGCDSGEVSLTNSVRRSGRKSIRVQPFHHFPSKVPKEFASTPEKRVSSYPTRNLVRTASSEGGLTPIRSAEVEAATTPKRSMILNRIEDTEEYRAGSGTAGNESYRRSSRGRQPNKKYISEHIGETTVRITLTPKISKPSGVKRGFYTPKTPTRSSISSSSRSPVASNSKSYETPKTGKKSVGRSRKSNSQINSVSATRGRRVRTPGSSKLKLSTNLKLKRVPSKHESADKDYDSGEATTISDYDSEQDTDSCLEDESENESGGSDTSFHGPRNLLQQFENMDFENALTPEVLKQLSTKKIGNSTPRRLLQVFQGNEQESPNPENFFLASNRLKFLPEKKVKQSVPNDAKKGKGRPRKGTRGIGGERTVNLPERPKLNFSVTKEANRVAASKLVVPLTGTKHAMEIESLLNNSIVPDFPRWIFFMSEGFNVMLHGYGSKLSVFQAFKAHLDGQWLVITVNGLYPKLNPRKFLLELCNSLELEEKVNIIGANVDIIAEEIYDQLKDTKHPRVFLLVKNFDSLAIRFPSFLAVLSSIARVKWIHILASSDNVNTFLGVNQNQSVQLNFCWISCSTFEPYEEELTWVPGVFGEEKNGSGSKTTLQYVLKSLTGNARKAFSILASLQLIKMKGSRGKRSKEFTGVEFRDLARRCRERFIAHSDTALKTLLIEFVDHKLITHSGKNKNVGNLLTIDLDKETLEELANAGF